MTEGKIRFDAVDPTMLSALPAPTPAAKQLPDWFKRLAPKRSEVLGDNTVKRCMPVLDAMSTGFIIPLWCDLQVTADFEQLSLDTPHGWAYGKMFDNHDGGQLAGYPLEGEMHGMQPVKFLNPWVITTPKGWSCLFINPANHFNKGIHFFEGVVDTDNYYNPINFPFVWRGGIGKTLFKRGTPLIQVIPFKREKLALEIGEVDVPTKNATSAQLSTVFDGGYKRFFRHQKNDQQSGPPLDTPLKGE